MLNLDREKLIHMNKNYQVVFIPILDRLDLEKGYEGNFEVRNRVYDTVEYYSPNLPEALVYAESLNNILVEKTYLTSNHAFGSSETTGEEVH